MRPAISYTESSSFDGQSFHGPCSVNQIHARGDYHQHIYRQARQSAVDRLATHSIIEAAYSSRVLTSAGKRSCLEGTRRWCIAALSQWMTGAVCAQERLLWVYGAAGVGKSAIAKSCAEVTAVEQKLGASFFFIHGLINNHTRMFPTISRQLAIRFEAYNTVLSDILERDPDLLTEAPDILFDKLFVNPFLALLNDPEVHIPGPFTVLVDGLEECELEEGQAEIAGIISKSIAKHGVKIPIRWAIFSRPEPRIRHAFDLHFPPHSDLFQQFELSITDTDDSDIRLYFKGTLNLSQYPGYVDTASTEWPSDDELDALVKIVKQLFVFAVSIGNFIMDFKRSHDPVKRLKEVLETKRSGAMADLDSFYYMIMGRISPEHLAQVQQALLLHNSGLGWNESTNTPYSPPLRILANLTGLTLSELKNVLLSLSSVLKFEKSNYNQELIRVPIPGQEELVFFHMSFMEFLAEETRSKEYWIKHPRHHHTLALRAISILNSVTAMNGKLPHDKLPLLRDLLPVFPDESDDMDDSFKFRDELVHDILTAYAFEWSKRGNFGGELENRLDEYFRRDPRPQLKVSLDDEQQKLVLPERIRKFIGSGIPKMPGLGAYSKPYRGPSPDIPEHFCKDWESIASVLWGSEYPHDPSIRTSHACVFINKACGDPTKLVCICSQVCGQMSACLDGLVNATKLIFETKFSEEISDFKLLDFYSRAWFDYQTGHNTHFAILASVHVPVDVFRAAIEPWRTFYCLVEGRDARLTGAVMRILNQWRNRDILATNLPSIFEQLRRFNESIIAMARGQLSCTDLSRYAYIEATEAYYATNPIPAPRGESFNPVSVAQTCLKWEHCILGQPERDTPWSGEIMGLSAEAVVKAHGDEIFMALRGALSSQDEEAIRNVMQHLRLLFEWSRGACEKLGLCFREHIDEIAQSIRAGLEESGVLLETGGPSKSLNVSSLEASFPIELVLLDQLPITPWRDEIMEACIDPLLKTCGEQIWLAFQQGVLENGDEKSRRQLLSHLGHLFLGSRDACMRLREVLRSHVEKKVQFILAATREDDDSLAIEHSCVRTSSTLFKAHKQALELVKEICGQNSVQRSELYELVDGVFNTALTRHPDLRDALEVEWTLRPI